MEVGVVNRIAGVRIDGVLAEEEREVVAQVMSSLGAHPSSLRSHGRLGRTYGLLELDEHCDLALLSKALADARFTEPPPAIVEIVPDHERRLPALVHALGGPGRPAGVLDAVSTAHSLVLEIDVTKTALSLILDIVDVELQTAPGRRIIPIIPLTDTMLAALARDLVGDPALDISRLIETYTEPMLQARQT
jgi:hypothetical protein